jgi:hypothetical protein
MKTKKVELTKEQIEWLDKCSRFSEGRDMHHLYEIGYRNRKETWGIGYNGKIDIFSDFDCSGQGLTDFMGIEFGRIEGSFNCSNNKLTSLKGSPESIFYSFNCKNNQLESLEGITQSTGTNSSSGTSGDIYCSGNKLTSLKGLPKTIRGNLNCSNNLLETLHGAPKRINCDFNCSGNKLVTLIGGPESVGGNLERTEDFEKSDRSYKCTENPISDAELFKAYREYKKALKDSKKYVKESHIEKAKKSLE